MSSELTKSCLTFEDRPSTPPEIRKFRRSTNLEPGKRFQHPGVADDYEQMKLSEKVFGYVDKSVKTTAFDLLSHPKPSELERINKIRAETHYKSTNREPLGRSPDRKVKLPSKFTLGNVPFGEPSKNEASEPAKDVIFPEMASDIDQGSNLYKKSHGSYAPGEQRSREYKWNIDPVQTRFGRKGDTIALNGVSTNIVDVLHDSSASSRSAVNLKQVENFRNMGVVLGQSKNLGQDSASRPADIVYGKKNPNKGVGALEVIRGKYSEAETEPDKDLGKSIMPGFRNISLEDRAYGCPSIRNDIPTVHPSRRSLADSQNYGDDVPAQDLINPPAFSDLAIGPLAMQEQRPKGRLLELFERIGYTFTQETADAIFRQASNGRPTASINEFRGALNDYLITNDLVRK